VEDIKPAQLTVLKKQVSKELLKQMHLERLRSLNLPLNLLIEEKTRTILSFLENTAQINVRRVYLRFIEDVSGEVYFVGVKHDILYEMKPNQASLMA